MLLLFLFVVAPFPLYDESPERRRQCPHCRLSAHSPAAFALCSLPSVFPPSRFLRRDRFLLFSPPPRTLTLPLSRGHVALAGSLFSVRRRFLLSAGASPGRSIRSRARIHRRRRPRDLRQCCALGIHSYRVLRSPGAIHSSELFSWILNFSIPNRDGTERNRIFCYVFLDSNFLVLVEVHDRCSPVKAKH